MLMELVQLRETRADEPDEVYEDELHDVNAIIMDVCIALGDTGAFEFRVSGFGDGHWPVDVGTDLATVLEQLPSALASLRSRMPFQIDLFEQGVQRRLDFVAQDSSYQVTCISGTSWTPDPAEQSITSAALDAMLAALGQTFVSVTRKLLPGAAAHPWFAAYAVAVLRQNRKPEPAGTVLRQNRKPEL